MALTPFNSLSGFAVGESANLVIDANSNVTANSVSVTGNVTADQLIGDGSLLTNITGANVTGIVDIANVAYAVSGANVSGEVANAYYAQQAGLANVAYSVDAANVVGTVANAAYATLSGTAAIANAANAVDGANVSGTVANATYATFSGTVANAAQANITSVGTLTSLSVTGNIDSSANIAGLNLIQDGVRVYKWTTDTTAPANPVPGDNWYNSTTSTLYQFINDGVSSQWVDQSSPSTFDTIGVGNITNLGANATGNIGAPTGYFGNAYVATVQAGQLVGNGYQITNINGANITGVAPTATTAVTVTANAQPNITSVGALTALTVDGDTIVNGNLTVDGDIVYNNVVSFNVEDPIIGLGRGANNTPLTNSDGKDRGEQLWYYDGAEKSAFIGYDSSTGKLTAAIDTSIANDVVTVNSLGNIVLGNIEATTVSATGNIAAAYLVGNGSQLTDVSAVYATVAGAAYSVDGANVSGQVGNALVAGTVYTNAQPNITSVGTLTDLTVSGNIVSNNSIATSQVSAAGNVISGGYFIGDGSQLTGIAPTVQVYEFANTISTGGYYEATWLADYTAGALANVSATVTTTPTNIASFVTEPGYPNITVIPTGTILTRIETTKASGPQGYYVYAEIYKRTSGGVETLIATSDDSSTITQNNTVQQNLIAYITSPVALASTDSIVSKIIAVMTSSSATITISFDDNTGSGLQLPALPASAANFVPYTGATADLNLGAFNLSTTGTVSGAHLVGEAGNLSNIAGGNVNGFVANATLASTANVASVAYAVSGANVSGFVANATLASTANVAYSVDGANVVGTVADAAVAQAANVAAEAYLVSGANVSGFVANATLATTANTALTVAGANVSGQVGNALVAGTVYTNAQPNITSVGTLTSLAVTGNVTGGNLATAGTATVGGLTLSGNTIVSSGSTLTIDPNSAGGTDGEVIIAGNLQVQGNVTFINANVITINDLLINVANNAATASEANGGGLGVGPANAEYATFTYNSTSNTWVISNGANVSGALTATGAITGTQFNGSGAGLTNLAGGNVTGFVANATLADTANVASVAYSVDLANVAGAGNIAAINLNGSSSQVLAGNGAWFTPPAGYSDANVSAYLAGGTDTANIITTGNISGGFIIGNGSQLTGLPAGYTDANVSTYLASGTDTANIITTGNVSGGNLLTGGVLSATGNVRGANFNTAGIVSATGNVTGNFIIGNGAPLTGLLGWYASNTAPSTPANGSFWYNTDTNVKYQYYFDGTNSEWVDQTSPSSFDNLTVSGNVFANNFSGNGASLTNIAGAGITGPVANATYATTAGIATTAYAVSGANVSGFVANATYATSAGSATTATTAGTVTTAAQSNITSVGTLTSLAVTGNITSGNLSGTSIVGTLTTAAQPNITSVGTLTSVAVTGNVQGGNLNTAGLVSATGQVTGSQFNGSGAGLSALPGANVTGTLSVNTTGSAATLTTSRNINGVAFNGSADITVTAAAGTLTGTTLNSTVVTSSLTAVGALNSGSITSGFGAIDIGVDTVTCGGIVNSNANGVGNIGSSTTYFNTVFAKATSAQYADLAERYAADAEYAPGTVVVFGGESEITTTTTSHDTRVAGVISTEPAHLMNATADGLAVALTGRVPCLVVGKISKGDRLVSSTIAGVATIMDKSYYEPGCIIGKALEAYDSEEVGTIEVSVGRF